MDLHLLPAVELPPSSLEEFVTVMGRAAYIRPTMICRSGHIIVQELCESRGGRPELSVLTSLLVSVDVKLY